MTNNTLHKSGHFLLTPVSPLHIGSGQTLTPMDYEIRKGRYIVKDILRFIDDQRADPAYALQIVEDHMPIGDDYIRYELPCYDDAAPQPHGGAARDAGEVRECIKDPMGRPFIPGSSLKGCLRTAMAWQLAMGMEPRDFSEALQETLRGRNRQWAFNVFNKAFFCGDDRGDPKADILKALVVRDSQPLDMQAWGAMTYLRVMNVTRNGFKPKQGMPIRLEALMPGNGPVAMPFVIQTAMIKTDPNLRRAAQGKPAAILAQPEQFIQTLHAFSQRLIDYEYGFYKDYCEHNEQALRFIQRLKHEQNAIYLDLGFGTGWHAKTIGMTFEDDEVRRVRRQFQLNDRGPDEYPKTRKWARTPEGYQPLGWIKLEVQWD